MRLSRDTAGGLFLIAIAVIFAIGAGHLGFGTMFRMGPGFYPTVVSALLGGIGFVLAVSGLRDGARQDGDDGGDRAEFELSLRSVAAVLGGLLVFAFALERVGLILSAFLLVGIAALAEKQNNFVGTLVLGVCLAAMAVLIFSFGLGLNIPLARWPF